MSSKKHCHVSNYKLVLQTLIFFIRLSNDARIKKGANLNKKLQIFEGRKLKVLPNEDNHINCVESLLQI